VRIAVLGTGNVGTTLGKRWAETGHQVCFGTRDPQQPRGQELARLDNISVCDWRGAVEQADVVLPAVPWNAILSVVDSLGDALRDKVLIDCTNPLKSDFSGLELGFHTSASEQIAERARGAHVVKAFNMVSAATMRNLFYCGDQPEAKQTVAQLAEELGFDPVDAGPLTNARLLEPLAMLYIHLAFHGWGSQCAFQVMKR
jgi:8-hydroxy-5-deazaflavin:NADPH oxidoreductase